ncbi:MULTISPECIES: AMP-binding protein [unclassified Azospirillum]|uniref:AMP-binding protein n=1 Tax=unclassified Azospirillum TaxID=2630922 RepID=UPI000B65A50A|nr:MULTISPECIES: AMP-binding protein [unclassified Azospirillum]SNS79292.1 fatty-acyl-CoA synthase [Azospirillum sp. RU38E]SNS96625.1 fatty-acyl-CoA synthase [Azospirillum sp. RU37A]
MQHYELLLDKFLRHAAKWHPDTEVVTGGDEGSARIGYADLLDRCNRLSGALLALGLRFGDRLGTLAWNSQAHMECWYAALGVGLVCHTLNPRIGAPHLSEMILKANDRVLAVSPGQDELVAALVTNCPCVEHVVVLDEPGVAFSAPPVPDRVRVWRQSDLLQSHGAKTEWGGFAETANAGLCFTSGTTGAPKGVLYTHRSNYLHTANIVQPDILGLSAQDSVLAVVPMFHANAWGLPFAAPAVGAKFVLPGRRTDGARLAELINGEGVTVAAGIPTVWLGLVDHLEKHGGELPSLKRVLLGGSSVPEALMERIEKRLGAVVQPSWGMTELSPLGTVAAVNSPHRSAKNSGRPCAGVDLRLVNETGSALPQQRGVEGRLQVKGASVLERYFDAPETALDAEGWFNTGDLAVIDAHGNLTITGRTKDLIKSGGEWINPGEIEAIIGTVESVGLAAVIARADAKWTERPVLIVEARAGQNIDQPALMGLLESQVPRWWLPDAIIEVEKMPLAATGKIDRMKLRQQFGQQPT